MKFLSLVLVFAVLIFFQAQLALAQQRFPPGTIPGRDQIPGGNCFPGDRSPFCDPWGRNDPWGNNHGGGSVSCAPEVVDGNVNATERTLNEVVATPQFASATAFRAEIQSIAKLKNQNAKVTKYFALIGIDGSSNEAVANFIGARNINPEWITNLQRATQLNDQQADVVARRLQIALRGNLK